MALPTDLIQTQANIKKILIVIMNMTDTTGSLLWQANRILPANFYLLSTMVYIPLTELPNFHDVKGYQIPVAPS